MTNPNPLSYDPNYVNESATQTITGKTISGASNTITNLALTSAVTGILPVANGGTNASSASAARTSLGAANIAGDTFTGQIQFSGTTHAGIKLLSLTTTERNALTAATGMLIHNVTTAQLEEYNGSSWVNSSGADEKAKVSSNDTTAGYLNGKLVAGTNITFTENNDGGNETLTIAASGGSSTVSSYVAQAFTAQTSVTVTHNFGQYPVVQVTDNSNATLIPLTITHGSTNAFTVTFTSSTTGTILATIGSPQQEALVTKTSNYTAAVGDTAILVDATSGAITITLPTAVGISGKVYSIKKIDSSTNVVTIDGNGSETIDGTTTKTIGTQYNGYRIISNGTNWYII